jgi:hypothetical protein
MQRRPLLVKQANQLLSWVNYNPLKIVNGWQKFSYFALNAANI